MLRGNVSAERFPREIGVLKSGTSVLRRIAEGDQSAVRECIGAFGPLVWSMARRMTRSSADAEDATQEIFIDIWRSAARFDARLGPESAFIATIARRRLIDRIRRLTPEQSTVSLEELDFVPQMEVAGSAEASFDLDQVELALAQLPNAHREVLKLALVQGFSHSEIADQLNMPLGTVKSSARRGLLRLRELINVSVVETHGGANV